MVAALVLILPAWQRPLGPVDAVDLEISQIVVDVAGGGDQDG